ncbi:MAG: ATP-binding protein, partial [Phormidesmis sp.]
MPSKALLEKATPQLTNCDREPIRIPGQIQPHGILIVLAPTTLEILQVSANVESWLAIPPNEILGQPLSQLLGDDQAQTIHQAVLTDESSHGQRLSITLPAQLANEPEIASARQPVSPQVNWHGLLTPIHTDTEVVLLELTPGQSDSESSKGLDPIALYEQLRQGVSQFQQAHSPEEVANIAIATVQAITGLNRVMVYKLGDDYSGAVIAEAIRDPKTEERFLDLRFPATDIPAQARQLYLQNWLRMIPDVSYTPVPLVPERHPQSQHPTDLGAAELRSVSPVHVEYLQNMGVKASMSISLMVEDRLWGLIACHHPKPKYIDYETRKACEFLGQVTSVELFRHQTIIEKKYQAQVHLIQQQIRQTISQLQPAHAIESVLIEYQQELLTLVQASGAVIALGSQMIPIGETPPTDRIRPILSWLVEQNRDIYHTAAFPQFFEPATQDIACASGLLAISIFLPEASYHILWFRPEQKQLVHWAGNPNKPATIAADGSLYLTPRQSFERWQERVYGQSLPWQATEIAAAQDLRATLLLTALEFSRSALREAAKKAQVANQAKSQFLAKMSHELRTPLNAILGFTQLIHYHETLSSDQRDRLNIINRSGEHLLSLINDVLETSRIEAGQTRLNESCFDLYQFIASVCDMLTLRAIKKGLLLKLEQTEPLPQYVWGDEGKLRQIIINLVGNAVKFTAQGEVTLRVSSAASSTKDQVRVQFEIADTGPGIAPENFKAIFEPFHQAETGRNSYEGSGLGLSISRQNARLMGGDIEVHSQPKQGSTFTCHVQLGVMQAADLEPSPVYRRVVALAPNQPSYRILVVEDVVENRQLLVSLLTMVGFEVCAVEDGRQAVERWCEWQPHCIWMDLYMPEMNGYEATRQIRAAQTADRSEAPTTPTPTPIVPTIIALSASVLDHMRDEVMEVGFDDYVCKPFQIGEIFEKMRQRLGVKYQYSDELASPDQASLGSNEAIAAIETWSKERLLHIQAQLKSQPAAWKQDF